FMDDSTPSGNGIAAGALLRLGHLLGETRYLDAAERTLRAAWHSMQNSPAAHNALLSALEDYLSPPAQVIIRAAGSDLSTWRKACKAECPPFADIFPIPSGCGDLPGLLAERKPLDTPVAYICEGHTCRAPVTNLDLLRENLNNSGREQGR
ncbi:MAG: thioredoxin domain-containing protein, partial [Gammaproteobacteria bacterium]|nr:thioredoxin domain-containing protein [Gammaproteobacteria bacterium]